MAPVDLTLNWITAVGTVAAALVAALSALAAVAIAVQRRDDDDTERRLGWTIDLLAAFESIEQHKFRGFRAIRISDGQPTDVELKDARARFKALLAANRESLDLTRLIASMFDDPSTTAETWEEFEDSHRRAPRRGHDGEDFRVQIQRAEIWEAVDVLNARLRKSGALLRPLFRRLE